MIPRMLVLFLVACGTSAAPEAPPPAPAPAAPAAQPPKPAAPPPAAEHHGDGHAHHDAPSAPAPATLSEAIGALERHREEMKALVEAGNLGEIHPHTEEMDKIVVMLPVQSKELAPADKNIVTLAATDLKKVLDALHHAADAGDAAKTRAELARLDEQIGKLSTYK
jgi:hypothetical protein